MIVALAFASVLLCWWAQNQDDYLVYLEGFVVRTIRGETATSIALQGCLTRWPEGMWPVWPTCSSTCSRTWRNSPTPCVSVRASNASSAGGCVDNSPNVPPQISPTVNPLWWRPCCTSRTARTRRWSCSSRSQSRWETCTILWIWPTQVPTTKVSCASLLNLAWLMLWCDLPCDSGRADRSPCGHREEKPFLCEAAGQ